MHWIMWIFWGTLAVILITCFLVDFLSKGKYNMRKPEKTLNQNSAEADALRQAGQNNHHNGMF